MTAPSPPARTVSGRYRVQEPIGSGGFGSVWRATDEEGGADVAIKFPRTDENDSNDASEVRSRFRNEYDVLDRFESALSPTSVVRYVDGRRTDPAYLVLEYVDGRELTDRLADGTVEPGLDTARRFGFPVIRALEFLHRNGTCYLDCKPENVLVRDRDDAPVLIDFNTAEPATEAETLFYEDDYKAPEQVPTDDRAAGPGPRSDVYAAGKLLCYLLTGTTLPTTETPTDGIAVDEHGASPPSEIARILQRATAADPHSRPADAGALLTELYRACGRDASTVELVPEGTDVVCPVRPDETVGRVTDVPELPDVGVADDRRYVSPIQFRIERDDTSWLIRDRSLNGTYVADGEDWRRLLSAEGERRLKRESPESLPAEGPYRAARIRETTVIAPVDPSYARIRVETAVDD